MLVLWTYTELEAQGDSLPEIHKGKIPDRQSCAVELRNPQLESHAWLYRPCECPHPYREWQTRHDLKDAGKLERVIISQDKGLYVNVGVSRHNPHLQAWRNSELSKTSWSPPAVHMFLALVHSCLDQSTSFVSER